MGMATVTLLLNFGLTALVTLQVIDMTFMHQVKLISFVEEAVSMYTMFARFQDNIR